MTGRYLRTTLARCVCDTRLAIGWSQQELAVRARISRQMVASVEAGSVNVSIDVAAALIDALGLRVDLVLTAPFLADRRRQREPAHARCSAYSQRRLEGSGWIVRREVEIAHGRSHGWIDLVAFDPRTGLLLVIEVKTEIEDLGRVERTLGWYEREAWDVARAAGWRVRRATSALLLLATEANDRRLLANREVAVAAFPVRATGMQSLVRDPGGSVRGRALAMIDPRSRRADWCVRTRIDGRRSPAPYADYADFMRVIGRHRPSG